MNILADDAADGGQRIAAGFSKSGLRSSLGTWKILESGVQAQNGIRNPDIILVIVDVDEE